MEFLCSLEWLTLTVQNSIIAVIIPITFHIKFGNKIFYSEEMRSFKMCSELYSFDWISCYQSGQKPPKTSNKIFTTYSFDWIIWGENKNLFQKVNSNEIFWIKYYSYLQVSLVQGSIMFCYAKAIWYVWISEICVKYKQFKLKNQSK